MSASVPALIETAREMQAWSRNQRRQQRRIGFVPTMGNLHVGHIALARQALAECEAVVASIFVNPTQFGPGEDFKGYPRTLAADLEQLGEIGVPVCFFPAVEEIYPPGDSSEIRLHWGRDRLCAAQRPGHFDGVCNVVARLFNAVLPDRAYFGQKDAQQALLIRRMARDLRFPLELRLGETVREEDGLALSSRNAYLDEEQRQSARALSAALQAAGAALREGERDPAVLTALGEGRLNREPGLELEYFAVVDPDSLETPAQVGQGLILMATAARLGRARLIDNLVHRIDKDGCHESLLF